MISDKYTPKNIHQQDCIFQFTSDIRYIKGSDTIVAGILSRSTTHSVNYETFDLIINEQHRTDTLDNVKETFIDERVPCTF